MAETSSSLSLMLGNSGEKRAREVALVLHVVQLCYFYSFNFVPKYPFFI